MECPLPCVNALNGKTALNGTLFLHQKSVYHFEVSYSSLHIESESESGDVPPPLPEKSKIISPPAKPPRVVQESPENDIKMYKKITGVKLFSKL